MLVWVFVGLLSFGLFRLAERNGCSHCMGPKKKNRRHCLFASARAIACLLSFCLFRLAARNGSSRYRLDSQLSAPHRFMTLGSWTCKAGPPSRYRHIFLKLPNRRSFYLLTNLNKTNTPSLRSAKPSNHFRKPGGGFWKYVEQGRFLHVKSMIFMWSQ